MVTQRVRVACPSCSRYLRIRLASLGKMGECRYCGHRFRAGTKLPKNRVSDPAESRASGREDQPANVGQWVRTMERELQQSWDLLTSQQASVVQGLIATLERRVQSQEQAGGQSWRTLASDSRSRMARFEVDAPQPDDPEAPGRLVEPRHPGKEKDFQ